MMSKLNAPLKKNVDVYSNSLYLGWWQSHEQNSSLVDGISEQTLHCVRQPFYIVRQQNHYATAVGGNAFMGNVPSQTALPIIAYVASCNIQNLGDPSFCQEFALKYPYVAGAMAHGINSVTMVESLANQGMLSFFGCAGLTLEQIRSAIEKLAVSLPGKTYGFNLIYSPNEPRLEDALVQLYLDARVKLIEASAYMGLTLPLVRYRLTGIHCDSSGKIIVPNKIIAKVSRVEMAEKFFAPAPPKLLQQLVSAGTISEQQAQLAQKVPIAENVTVEADSGGHTDNRPAVALIPTMVALRKRMQQRHSYANSLRIGAAGGIGTPDAVAAAFAMGADYVVTGSINQGCIESGTSDVVREMLAQTQQADVTMAYAADMFEMGVKVQVLKRGTLFAMRSAKLYEIYQNYNSVDEIPAATRSMLEKQFLRATFDEIWADTCEYFQKRDASPLKLAANNPKYKMALIFRWYLSHASHWAISGDVQRKIDYQIWCGPAMGSFNEWAKGSFLEVMAKRKVTTVALNLLYGAAVLTRIHSLRTQGIPVDDSLKPKPMTEEQIHDRL